MRRTILALVLLAAAPGCGDEPRLDATDDDSASRSIAAMTEGMSEAERLEFRRDVIALTVPAAASARLRAALGRGPAPEATGAAVLRPLHGLTVAEIRAKAAEARAARRAVIVGGRNPGPA